MSKHKALELAEKLRTRNGNASGFGLGPVCDEADATIRAQHALIVQMREALATCECAFDPVGNDGGQSFDESKVDYAIAAANQYLKAEQ